jgi:hypothetical protein
VQPAPRKPRSLLSWRRFVTAIALPLGLGLVAVLTLRAIPKSQVAAPPYSVAGFRAALAQHPGTWSGRVVHVRGILEGPFVFCADTRPCPRATLGLIDTEDQAVGPNDYLLVTTEAQASPLRLLREVPLISAFVPAPQTPQFGRMSIYRLRVAADPALCSRNHAVMCYVGVALTGA